MRDAHLGLDGRERMLRHDGIAARQGIEEGGLA